MYVFTHTCTAMANWVAGIMDYDKQSALWTLLVCVFKRSPVKYVYEYL